MNVRDFLLGATLMALLMMTMNTNADHGGIGNHPSAYCPAGSTAMRSGFVHHPTDGSREWLYVCQATSNGALVAPT